MSTVRLFSTGALLPVLVLAVACTPGPDSGGNGDGPGSSGPTRAGTGSGTASATLSVPDPPSPTAGGPCPYLTGSFVEQTNGQRVGDIRTSSGRPHPACFFYRADGGLQLTSRVYLGDVAVARSLIDEAAPEDTANPADEPDGWTGGYQSTENGAVYAVTKGGTAVVVTTNQSQSVKARRVAKRVISSLGL